MDSNYQFDPAEGVYLLFDPQTDAKSPYVTTRSHSFSGPVTSITVPECFRFDFASVPGWLLWLFDPRGRHQRAAMFHDRLYRIQPCSRCLADSIFRNIMKIDGVKLWRRLMLFYGVRLFGRRAWNKRSK